MRVVPVIPAGTNSGGQRDNSAARGVKFPAPAVGRRRQRRGANGAGEKALALAPEDGKHYISSTVYIDAYLYTYASITLLLYT